MSRSDTFPLNVWRSCCMQHLTELVVNALVIKTDEDQEDYRHLRVLLDRFESKVRHLARVNLDVISCPFVHRAGYEPQWCDRHHQLSHLSSTLTRQGSFLQRIANVRAAEHQRWVVRAGGAPARPSSWVVYSS